MNSLEKNNIPVGYKDSAVGVIPQEWEVKLLEDLCENICSGNNKERNKYGKYRIYGSTGIIGYSNTYSYNFPTILIARVGANAGIINKGEGEYDVSDNTLIVCNNKFIYDYEFAYNQLANYNLNKLVFGSGQPLVTAGQLKHIKLPIPPLAEQRKIAEILGAWDEAIEKQSRLIEKLELRKRALMQRLLTGRTRLSGFTTPWQKVKLGEICKRVTRRNEENNQNVMTISAQKGFVSQTDFFNKSVASSTLDNYYLVLKDEFCYNKSYSNGYPMGAIKRLKEADKAVVTTLYICFSITDKQKLSIDFFEQYCENGEFNQGLMKIANEGGRAHGLLNVTPTDFFSLVMLLPTLPEQKAIAEVLTAADDEIATHCKKLNAMRLQKRGLMQQLLTGKTRVKI